MHHTAGIALSYLLQVIPPSSVLRQQTRELVGPYTGNVFTRYRRVPVLLISGCIPDWDRGNLTHQVSEPATVFPGSHARINYLSLPCQQSGELGRISRIYLRKLPNSYIGTNLLWALGMLLRP